MTHTYDGNRYFFEIEFVPNLGQHVFNLVAVHKKSLRYSTINTLNTILSWCDIPANDRRENDSDWILSKKEYKRFKKFVIDLFSDDYSISYLENRLDEDRSCGEWENRR